MASVQSTRAFYESGASRMAYTADAEHNAIPDFSYAGYRNGSAALPSVPTLTTLSPIAGDNTAHIQAALDSVAAPGAVKLNAGLYELSGQIFVNRSGVVLRGTLDADHPDDPAYSSVLRSTQIFEANPDPVARPSGYQNRFVVQVGGPWQAPWLENEGVDAHTDITSDFVPAGSRAFEVASTAGFAVGDNVIVRHPSTQAWLDAVDNGGTEGGSAWVPTVSQSAPKEMFYFNRYIEAIDGNVVTLHAPVFNHLDRSLSQSYMFKYDRAGIFTEIGVEDLCITTAATPGDMRHAWHGLNMVALEDSWAKNVVVKQFIGSGIATRTVSRVTVQDTKVESTIGDPTQGSHRYGYNVNRGTNDVLFEGVYAKDMRHAFISEGTTAASGVVFHNATSEGDYGASEGHRKWSIGLLFDNVTAVNPNVSNWALIGLYNRGNYGGNHGWAAAHSVAWNCDVGAEKLFVQKPPTAQNYAIGCKGVVTGVAAFSHPAGWIEHDNAATSIDPPSLFDAQRSQRTAYGARPDMARLLSATANGASVDLAWSASLDVPEASRAYDIEESTDGGATFSVIATATGSSTSASLPLPAQTVHYRVRVHDTASDHYSPYSKDIEFVPPPPPPVGWEYVRVYFPAGQSGYSRIILKEFRIYDENGTNVALQGTASASSYRRSSQKPERAIDNSTRTKWGANNDGSEEWITVELAATTDVTTVELVRSSSHFPPVYEVQVSHDNASWVPF